MELTVLPQEFSICCINGLGELDWTCEFCFVANLISNILGAWSKNPHNLKEVAAKLIRRGEFVRYPISKLIWAGLIIALIFLGAMFILPVVGAVLIGVFALSCLIWLSSKVFGFFQGGRTYTEDNPGDYYDASARTSIVPKKWNKTQAVDAEVIEVEEIKKREII